jgi:hypothetical protein
LSATARLLSWTAAAWAFAPNVANRKGFRVVVQCQNVAKSTPMQTTDEPAAGPSTPPREAAGTPVGTDGAGPSAPPSESSGAAALPREIGGRGGPEPTRFGDWEKAGRCIDF